MARKLKPLKVEEVRDYKTGRYTDLLFDRNTKTFYGVIDAESYSASTAVECRRLLSDNLAPKNLEWKQEIHISVGKGFFDRDSTESACMKLEFSRHEFSISPNGARLERRFWDEEEMKAHDEDWAWDIPRKERASGHDVHNCGREYQPTGICIPYSRASWLGLLSIRDAIEAAHDRLTELLSNASAEKFLLTVKTNSQLLLEPPKEK